MESKKLSSIDENRNYYMIVYHTGHKVSGSDEVELVKSKLFKSPEKAWIWYYKRYLREDFLNPTVVKVTLANLNLSLV
tara:strand:- start:194 stop:427 length:234 start_codon:yes stop_codon:yes gene_type:complete